MQPAEFSSFFRQQTSVIINITVAPNPQDNLTPELDLTKFNDAEIRLV
jgi:hypothetical protein